MIDTNMELMNDLSELGYNIQYRYPESFNEMPIITFYTLNDSAGMMADNEELIEDAVTVVDIWADSMFLCSKIAIEINDCLTKKHWSRVFMADLQPQNNIHHKNMRFKKSFTL